MYLIHYNKDKDTMLRSKYTMIRDTPSTYHQARGRDFLVLTKRSAASGDENVSTPEFFSFAHDRRPSVT